MLDNLGLISVVCVDNAATEGCSCKATINQPGGMAAISINSAFNAPEGSKGKYKAMDNKFVTTVEGVDTEYSYCVAENTLTVTVATPLPLGTLTGPTVLQKQ